MAVAAAKLNSSSTQQLNENLPTNEVLFRSFVLRI
jgi:hypothetical protein